jgi:hypothetical protein
MDPNMISQLLGGQGTPTPPSGATVGQGTNPQPSQGGQPPWIPLLAQSLDKLANMGVPFVGDIARLVLMGGGTPQTWNTLIKTIDSYGKHKQSVQGASIQGGPAGGIGVSQGEQPAAPPPQPMPTQENPQPPGVYS